MIDIRELCSLYPLLLEIKTPLGKNPCGLSIPLLGRILVDYQGLLLEKIIIKPSPFLEWEELYPSAIFLELFLYSCGSHVCYSSGCVVWVCLSDFTPCVLLCSSFSPSKCEKIPSRVSPYNTL